MKQVQISDEDASIVEITYRGTHTCIQTHQVTPALASIGKEIPKQSKDHSYVTHLESENQSQPNGGLFEYEQGLGVKIEDLGIMKEVFPGFSFPSTPIEFHNVHTTIFSDSVTENNFLGSDYSPAFISPETSESDYFSLKPCQMDDSFGLIQNLQHSGSDLTEIISAPTSVTNSPIIGDLDFSLDQVNLDPNFSFDTLEFSS